MVYGDWDENSVIKYLQSDCTRIEQTTTLDNAISLIKKTEIRISTPASSYSRGYVCVSRDENQSELSLSIAEHTHPKLEFFTLLNVWEMAELF